MTERQLARLIISAYEFKIQEEFDILIQFLTVCMYHTTDSEKAEKIQSAIWYLMDKKKALRK